MKIVSFITDPLVIKKILKHLGIWKQKPSRDPPNLPENGPAELGFIENNLITDSSFAELALI